MDVSLPSQDGAIVVLAGSRKLVFVPSAHPSRKHFVDKLGGSALAAPAVLVGDGVPALNFTAVEARSRPAVPRCS